MQDIQYSTFQTAQEAIASKATCIQITKAGNLSALSGAKHIKALRLSNIHLHEKLIKAFANMPNLEVLDLSNNHIKTLPSLEIPNLKEIDLSDNDELNIRDAFDSLSNLPKLQTLIVQRCNFSKIPEALPQLEQVMTVNIKGNYYLELPKFLKIFPNLQNMELHPEMKLSYDKVFKALAGIPNFCHLDLHSTKRSTVPISIKKIKGLTSINIDIKKLKNCEFLSPLNLQKLEINAPELKTPLFENLSNSPLQTLIIHHTIESLPEKILDHKALEVLDINLDSDNEEKTLGLIAKLPKLKKLHLSKHSHFPKAFGALSHLENITLTLGNNPVVFPKEVATFDNIVFESNNKSFAKKHSAYLEKYGKDTSLPDELKTKYFSLMLDQKLVQEEVFPYLLEHIEDKAVFFIAGQIEGYTQDEIKEKLKDEDNKYGYKIASKLSDKVTHVILGKNAKEEIIEEVLQNPHYKIVTEAHLKRHIIEVENPSLMQTGSEAEKMNESIMDLLLSETGLEIGLTMMEDGGASKQTLTVLYLFLTKYSYKHEKDVKRQMKKVFNRYASSSLKALLKNGKDENIHPDIDLQTCLRLSILERNQLVVTKPVLEQLGWEGITDLLSKGKEIETLHINSLGLKEFPISLIPYITSIRYLSMGDNDISVLPKELLQLTNLTDLQMENCKIEDISLLTQLEKLKYISIKNNPLKEVINKGRFVIYN